MMPHDFPSRGYGGALALTEAVFEESLANHLKAIELQEALTHDGKDAELKYQVECRLKFIDKLRRAATGAFDRKSIFISFSGTGADEYQGAKQFFAQKGYEVLDGFDDSVAAGTYIPKEVIGLVRRCTFFLGIWTATYDAATVNYTSYPMRTQVGQAKGSVPSVWMPSELGLAMALDKPFKIFIEDGAHPDFIEKPNLGQVKIGFKKINFKEKLEIAFTFFENAYRQRPSPASFFDED